MRFSFDEIVSTRKLRSQAGRQYLDIKCGNLMQQTVIRCETPYVSLPFGLADVSPLHK